MSVEREPKVKHVRIGYDVWKRVRVACAVLDEGLGSFCEGAIEARLSGMEAGGADLGGRRVVEVGWKKPAETTVPDRGVDVAAHAAEKSRDRGLPVTGGFVSPMGLADLSAGRAPEDPSEPTPSDLPAFSVSRARGEAAERVAAETLQPTPEPEPLDLSGIPHDGLGVLGPPETGYYGQPRETTPYEPIDVRVAPGALDGPEGSGQVPGSAGKPGSAAPPVEPLHVPEHPPEGRNPGFENVVTDRKTLEAYRHLLEPQNRFTRDSGPPVSPAEVSEEPAHEEGQRPIGRQNSATTVRPTTAKGDEELF